MRDVEYWYLGNLLLFHCYLQLFVSAMGPPGGGRNDITGRFTRHLACISMDEFSDNTMSRIFTSIIEWHFSHGYDSSFSRMGKVSLKIGLRVSICQVN